MTTRTCLLLSMAMLMLVGAFPLGCAKAELDFGGGRAATRDDSEDETEISDSGSAPKSDASQDDEESSQEDTGPDIDSEETGLSPEEDASCGEIDQSCCGEGLCDNDKLVCIGGWPDESSSSCVAMCNGTFCKTTEGQDGACYPTSDPTMTYCDGGDVNPPTQTCGQYVTCPGGSRCLVASAGAAQGKCFKTGCDPYANCEGAKDLCIPLIDSNEDPTGYGACLPLL